MSVEILDGSLYKKLIGSGAYNLRDNRSIVNDLNVFPIPDGDTGDNMFMTIDSGFSSIRNTEENSLDKVSQIAAQGMLLGARGNSGVILSRIFKGIAKGLEGYKEVNVIEFGEALEQGIKESYSAVSVPVEGTILTVYKDAVRYANSQISNNSTFDSYYDDLIKELHASLKRTPDLLACLKEAGVVDSGGAGFVYIAEGMKKAIKGDVNLEEKDVSSLNRVQQLDLTKFNENSELTFGYCTEFLLQLLSSKIDVKKFDVNELEHYLNSVGDSVVCFQDGTIVKVHVHTKRPGEIFNHCQQYGEYLTMKCENMTLQHNQTIIHNRFEDEIQLRPHKKYGVVTVASGDGIKDTFIQLGVDAVVNGGQSMNPSSQDFIDAFKSINADNIIVYPNNSNIILTANQAASLYDQANIIVVPTKSIGEGYVAISRLDVASNDNEKILENAKEIISTVVSGSVSIANRTTSLDNVDIKEGDYICFTEDEILGDSSTYNEAAEILADELNAGDFDVMILLVGKDTKEDEYLNLVNNLSNKYPLLEIIPVNGGQPLYNYIMILE